MKSDSLPETRVDCTLQDDPRLIAGAGAIAAHIARQAGLSEHAQRDFHAAAEVACREAFQSCSTKGSGRATISLVAALYADRVEVALEYPAKKRAAGSVRRRSGGVAGDGRAAAPPASQLVDHIARTTRSGRCRVTLVKYCGVASPFSRR